MNTSTDQRGRYFFFAIFALLAVAVFFLLRPFLGIIAFSLVMTLVLRPVYKWFYKQRMVGQRSTLATTLTIFAFILIILVPIVLISIALIGQLVELLESLSDIDVEFAMGSILATIDDALRTLPFFDGIDIQEENVVAVIEGLARAILSFLSGFLVSFAASLPNLFIQGIIFLVLLASLLPSYPQFTSRLESLSPLDASINDLYLKKASAMTISMIKGVFLIAVIQGSIMGIFFWIAGVPFAPLLAVICMAFAILPAVGISFVVWPLAILFLLSGNVSSAVIVLVGFYAVVNPLDIILRPRLVSKEAYLNFALVLLGIFGGIWAFGVLGVIYGPVIMILFLTTIDIYEEWISGERAELGADLDAGDTNHSAEEITD